MCERKPENTQMSVVQWDLKPKTDIFKFLSEDFNRKSLENTKINNEIYQHQSHNLMVYSFVPQTKFLPQN